MMENEGIGRYEQELNFGNIKFKGLLNMSSGGLCQKCGSHKGHRHLLKVRAWIELPAETPQESIDI